LQLAARSLGAISIEERASQPRQDAAWPHARIIP
jgi:hypothetical protein